MCDDNDVLLCLSVYDVSDGEGVLLSVMLLMSCCVCDAIDVFDSDCVLVSVVPRTPASSVV